MIPAEKVLVRASGAGGLRSVCVKCGIVGPMMMMYADLRGRPFKDYYCGRCAKELLDSGRAELQEDFETGKADLILEVSQNGNSEVS